MPERKDAPHATDKTPPARAPDGQQLSEQERQDLEAAERGYSPEASALPETGKPLAPPKSDHDTLRARAEQRHGTDTAEHQAEKKGLIPGPGTSAPPLDGEA